VRLTGFHIDGFGVFSDQGLPDLAPGLTAFLGANEAGKSTLLAFLRAMLYGFERADSLLPRYEGISAGIHGGRLELVTRGGVRYRLDRHAGRRTKVAGETKLTSPEGTVFDPGHLTSLLGGTSREAYYSICAFSLTELQALESLASEQVRGRIWTAGVGAGDISLADVERQLRAERDKLYKPKGQDWPVNNLLRRLRELRKALREARDSLDVYDREKQGLESLEREAATLAEEADGRRRRLARLEQYQKAWEVWGRLRADREERALLPTVSQFPTDGVRRLEQLRDDLRRLTEEAGGIADRIEAARKEREGLPVDQALIGLREPIVALGRGEQDLRKCLRDLPSVEAQARTEQAHLEDQLRDLGPDWDEQRLRTIDVSKGVVDAALQLGDSLRRAEERVTASERDATATGRAADTAQITFDEERAALAGLPATPVADAEELRRRAGALGGARQALVDLQNARAELQHQEERRADLEQRRASASVVATAFGQQLPVWVRVLLGLLLGGVVAGLTRTVPGVVGGVVVAAAVIAALLWSGRQANRLRRAARERAEAQRAEIEQTLAQLERALTETRARLVAAQAHVDQGAAVLDVHLSGLVDVEAAAQQVEEAREALRRRQASESAVEKAERVLAGAVEQRQAMEESLAQAGRGLETARATWRAWLAERGLPPAMTPDGFRDMVESVRRLREALKNLDQMRRRVEGMNRDVATARQAAAEVWQARGRTPPAEEDLANGIAALSAELQQALDDAAEAREVDRRLADLEDQQRRAEDRRAQASAEVAALFQQAGARDEEEFRRLGELHARRRDLEQRIADAEQGLALIAGFGAERLAFEAELEQINPAETELRLVETRQELQALTDRQAQVHQDLGSRRAILQELETSEAVARYLQEQSEKQEQLREQIEEYGTLSAALHLLRKAREKYERERQPEVVRAASDAVERITAGRYRRVIVPPDQFIVRLETAEGAVREIEQLSRGTQQQLYLAMRLAYVRVQNASPGAEPLPLIMDEVLVNFDPQRARRTAELILDVARENQVFVFTCHPDTVALFREVDPTVPVVDVRGGQLRPVP
jgi:uncharacterized protein YhaN